eukprot:3383623-Prymnesium_polylepis.1
MVARSSSCSDCGASASSQNFSVRTSIVALSVASGSCADSLRCRDRMWWAPGVASMKYHHSVSYAGAAGVRWQA